MIDSIDARVEKSRTALMNLGMKLLVASPDASLSEIASQAGVGRTTLYRQFNSKEALIQAIAKRCLEDIDAATTELMTQAETYTEAIEFLFVAAMSLPDRFQFLASFWIIAEQDSAIVELEKRSVKALSEMINSAKREGSIDQQIPTGWIVDLIDSLLLVTWKLVLDSQYKPDEAANLMTKTLFDGIRPRS